MWPSRRSRDQLFARVLVGAVLLAVLVVPHWLGVIELGRR